MQHDIDTDKNGYFDFYVRELGFNCAAFASVLVNRLRLGPLAQAIQLTQTGRRKSIRPQQILDPVL